MRELGELEAHFPEFEKRHTRIVALSLEGLDEATASQADFPHLLLVSDAQRTLADAVEVIQPRAGPGGRDTVAPTTIVVDGSGTVRWVFRPERYIVRLTPAELISAIDEHLPPP